MTNNVTDVTDVRVINDFHDDRVLCVEVGFKDQTGAERAIELMWCGPDGFAAASYANSSPEAKTKLIKMINEQIEDDADDEAFANSVDDE